MTILTIEQVDWEGYRSSLTDIRHRVFVDEQRVPIDLEIDEHDPLAQHWLASIDDSAVGTVRLLKNGHIGRMAVLAPFRKQGIGRDLLDTVIATAKVQSLPVLRLAAQQQAIGFYRKAGFKIYGEPFLDAGIVHVGMELSLHNDVVATPDDATSGRDFSTLSVDICGRARRQLRIFSHSLDEQAYAKGAVTEALSALARKHRDSEVRLLICDDRPLRELRHPLVELSRRLSAVQIRVAHTALQQEIRDYFVIADMQHFAAYTRHGKAGVRGGTENRAAIREYIEQFDRIWHLSRPSRWLQTLY